MTGQPQDQTQQTQQDQTRRAQSQVCPPAQQASWNPFVTLEHVGLLALGAVDLALDQVRQAAGRGQSVVTRSDLRELVADGVQDLKVRGELASRRVASADSDNYLELMARRSVERRARTADAKQPDVTAPPHA